MCYCCYHFYIIFISQSLLVFNMVSELGKHRLSSESGLDIFFACGEHHLECRRFRDALESRDNNRSST